MKRDDFGNRMKSYEGKESDRTLIPLLPALARLDGRAFHSFTSDMDRPYDARLSKLMAATTRWLVEETNACCGYTQSDEITLVWYSEDWKSQIFFDGRIMKMNSILAALTSSWFNMHIPDYFGGQSAHYQKKMPVFDCRVWNMPNIHEGANSFLWREKDATRNSIQMAAQHYYSQNELDQKSMSEQQEMLWQKGVNWNNYPEFFKRGIFVQRRKVCSKVTVKDLENLPKYHDARKNPELEIERTEYRQMEMPPFGKVINRPEVIFFGEDPVVMELADDNSEESEVSDISKITS